MNSKHNAFNQADWIYKYTSGIGVADTLTLRVLVFCFLFLPSQR